MASLIDLFQSVGPNYVLMFAKLFCIALAFQIGLNFKAQLKYFQTIPSRVYGPPIKLLGLFHLPDINRIQFIASGIGLIFCLIFSAIGIMPRLFIAVALMLYFLYFNPIISLAYIQRKTNLLPLVLLILLVSPSITLPLNGNKCNNWPCILVEVGIAQLYFSSGLQKIIKSGLSWCAGETMQAYLFDNYLINDRKPTYWLAKKKRLCALLSTVTLLFELSFGIILFLPQLTYIYIIVALSFHIVTLVTMRINYLKYLLPVYMVFFTHIAFIIQHKLCP